MKLLAILEPVMLFVTPAALFLCAYFGLDQTALLTMIAAIFSVIPFFVRFEKQKPRPRDIMPIVVLAAIATAGRIIFMPFPNFKPLSAIVIIGGACFGSQSGFLTGALSVLASNMVFSQGPWTPWQMYAFGLQGFLAGVLSRHGCFQKPLNVYIFGFLSAFMCGLILDTWTLTGFIEELTAQYVLTRYLLGLPFSLSSAVATVVFLIPTFKPWSKKIERIQTKYGFGMKNASG